MIDDDAYEAFLKGAAKPDAALPRARVNTVPGAEDGGASFLIGLDGCLITANLALEPNGDPSHIQHTKAMMQLEKNLVLALNSVRLERQELEQQQTSH